MKFNSIYQLSFNQLKFISLFSLIVVHCVSFTNDLYTLPLNDQTHIQTYTFALLGSYHVLFILMAGISFGKTQSSLITNGKMASFLNNNWVGYFFTLMACEAFKGYIIWGTVSYFLVWDFLKTIFLSFILISLLSQLHILINLLLAFITSSFYDEIKFFLIQHETLSPPDKATLSQWSFFHFHQLLTYAFIFLALLYTVWKIRIHPKLKRFLSLALLIFASLIAVYILKTTPSKFEYLYSQNWWIWPLVGSSSHLTLFPFLSWYPTIAIGFVGAYYSITFKEKINLKFLRLLFFVSSTLLFFTGYLMLNSNQIEGVLLRLWHVEAMSRSTFWGEVFKVTFFLFNFLVILFLNFKFKTKRTDLFFHKFSLATFWIYLASTFWPVFAARTLHSMGLSFKQNFTIVLISLLILSFFIAKLVYLLNSTSIKMKLTKH